MYLNRIKFFESSRTLSFPLFNLYIKTNPTSKPVDKGCLPTIRPILNKHLHTVYQERGSNSALIQQTSSVGSTVYNITVLTADKIIDRDKFKAQATQAIADATTNGILLTRDVDSTARYVMNVA